MNDRIDDQAQIPSSRTLRRSASELDRRTRLVELRAKLEKANCEIVQDGTETEATRRWNGALSPRPALVARCRTAAEVGAALRIADDANMPVSIHNGGHDWAGRSLRDGSVVLDISAMTRLEIDVGRLEATIGGGVTAAQLNRAAGERGLVAVIANDGGVSMAGFMLGGGYGPLMTRFGLACDNLLSAEVVLPGGDIVTCDAQCEADLFWALRGGGGNFGVVTAARVRLHAPEAVLAGSIVFPWADARAAIAQYGELMLRAPAELFGSAVLSVGPGGKPVVVISLVWTGKAGKGDAIVADVVAAGNPVLVKVEPMPASALLSLTDGKNAGGFGYEVTTRWFRTLASETVEALVAAFDARISPLASIIVQHCHGAATDVAPGATAFGMRDPHFTALVYAAWKPGVDDAAPHRDWAHRLDAALATAALPGSYANMLPGTAAADRVAHAFGPNGSRLASMKTRFDPTAVLNSIPLPPAPSNGQGQSAGSPGTGLDEKTGGVGATGIMARPPDRL